MALAGVGSYRSGRYPRSLDVGLARQARADQIPGTLVAVAERVPVGAVCLVDGDMPGHDAVAGLSPWIKGLMRKHLCQARP
jgi:hypothetical protein